MSVTLWSFLYTTQCASDSSSYRMKTPNSTIIAICQTKQTAGRLTRTLVFFWGPKKFPALSQQFPMVMTLCADDALITPQLGSLSLLSFPAASQQVFMDLWRGVPLLATHMQGVWTPHLLAGKPLLACKPLPLLLCQGQTTVSPTTGSTAGNKVISA